MVNYFNRLNKTGFDGYLEKIFDIKNPLDCRLEKNLADFQTSKQGISNYVEHVNPSPYKLTIKNWQLNEIATFKKDLQKIWSSNNLELKNQTKLALQIALANPAHIALFAMLVLGNYFNRPFNSYHLETLASFGFGCPIRESSNQDNLALKAYRGFGKTSLVWVLGTVFESLAVATNNGFGSKFVIICSLTEKTSNQKIELVYKELQTNGFIKNIYGDVQKNFQLIENHGLTLEKLPDWLNELTREGLKFIAQNKTNFINPIFENDNQQEIDIFAPINPKKNKANQSQVDLFGKVRLQAISTGQNPRGLLFNGTRPTRIVCDDILDDQAVNSKERRDEAMNWFKSALLPSLAPEGRVELINTPLHPQDIIEQIFNKKGVFNRGWKTMMVSAIDKNGQSVDENWKTTEQLNTLMQDSEMFAKEYLCVPVDSQKSIIKTENLRFWIDYQNQETNQPSFNQLANNQTLATLPSILEGYMHLDTTHTGNNTSDYFCAVYIGKGIDKNYYVVDFILEKLPPEQQALKSVSLYQQILAKNLPINKLTYDEKANQGLMVWLPKLAKEKFDLSLPLQPLKWHKNKKTHLQKHLNHFIAGRLYFPLHHQDIQLAMDQLLNFPSSSVHDDFVDGICGALDGFDKIIELNPKTRMPFF